MPKWLPQDFRLMFCKCSVLRPNTEGRSVTSWWGRFILTCLHWHEVILKNGFVFGKWLYISVCKSNKSKVHLFDWKRNQKFKKCKSKLWVKVKFLIERNGERQYMEQHFLENGPRFQQEWWGQGKNRILQICWTNEGRNRGLVKEGIRMGHWKNNWHRKWLLQAISHRAKELTWILLKNKRAIITADCLLGLLIIRLPFPRRYEIQAVFFSRDAPAEKKHLGYKWYSGPKKTFGIQVVFVVFRDKGVQFYSRIFFFWLQIFRPPYSMAAGDTGGICSLYRKENIRNTGRPNKNTTDIAQKSTIEHL